MYAFDALRIFPYICMKIYAVSFASPARITGRVTVILPTDITTQCILESTPTNFVEVVGWASTTQRGLDKKNKVITTAIMVQPYPGDPRFANRRAPTAEEVSDLGRHCMLQTNLLDILLQRSAPVSAYYLAVPSTSGRVNFLGPLSTKHTMETSVQHLEERKDASQGKEFTERIVRRIDKMRLILCNVFDLSGRQDQRLIIPIVQNVHFFVLVIDFDARKRGSNDGFISKVSIYDSIVSAKKRTTRQAVTNFRDSVVSLLHLFNTFVNNYVLHKRSHLKLRKTNDELMGLVSFEYCPQQLNGIDCGLFCVGVVLHLLDNVVVDAETFDSKDITALRMRLYVHFTGKVSNKTKRYEHVIRQRTSKVIRDSFNKLTSWDVPIIESGLADIDLLESSATDGTSSVVASEMESATDGTSSVVASEMESATDGTSCVVASEMESATDGTSSAGATSTSSRASTPGDTQPELVDTMLTSLLKDMDVGFFRVLRTSIRLLMHMRQKLVSVFVLRVA